MRVAIVVCLLATLLGSGLCQTPAAKLAKVAAATGRLRADVFEFWFTKGVDTNGLGVYGTLDRTGSPVAPTEKGLVQEARHLWAFSAGYGLLERSKRAQAAAGAVYKLLTTKMYDTKSGYFVTKVKGDGSVMDDSKSFTFNMYAVFALARYGRTFGDAAASKLAYAVFKKWDAACYVKGKGWDATRAGADKVPHSQDSSVHTLEALVELWQTFPKNAFVRTRLVAAVDQLALRVMLSGGKYSHREFDANWKPTGNGNVEFGHELVCTWMLLNLAPKLQAAGLISAKKAAKIRARAIKTGAYTAAVGYDKANGGFWTVGVDGTKPDTTQKVWWQQAEGALAMYQLYQATKNVKYLDRLQATVNWIATSQRDSVYGEWYWAVSPTTKQVMADQWPGTWKGLEWKASYHSGRSTLFLAAWLSGQSVF